MGNRNITKQLKIGTVILIMLIILQGIFLYWSSSREHHIHTLITKTEEEYIQLAKARYHHRVWLNDMENAFITGNTPSVEQYTDCKLGQWLYSLKPDPQEFKLIEKIKDLHKTLHTSAHAVVNLLKTQNKIEAQERYLNETVVYSSIMEQHMDALENLSKNRVNSLKTELLKYTTAEQMVLIISALIMILAAVLVTVNFNNNIVKPVLKVSDTIKQVHKGDFNQKIVLKTNNEIRKLAERFNDMLEPLKMEKMFHNVLQHMVSQNDLDQMLELVSKETVMSKGAATAAIYIYDEWNGLLKLQTGFMNSKNIKKHFDLGDSFVGQAAATSNPIIVENPDESWNIKAGPVDIALKSLAAFPIKFQDKLLGVMVVGRLDKFTANHINAFTRLATQLGIAINNINHYNSIKKLVAKLRQNNKDLDTQKKYMEAVLRSSEEGIFSIDNNGIIKTWSKGAERITGFSASEVIGNKCCDLIKHLDSNGNILCNTTNCYITMLTESGNSIRNRELMIKTKSGGRIPCMFSVAPIIGENNQIEGAVEVFRDISKEKQNLEKIKQANKAKNAFLATMSHELRTPLNSVLGFSELLESEVAGKLNDKQKRYVENVLSSGKHLLSLINDILDLSKIEAGKMEWEIGIFDMVKLIENSLIMVKERANKAGIEVELDVKEEGLHHVEGDERKIKQIIYNLLTNAIKFTPQGKVTVKAYRKNNTVTIEIIDTGIGIPREKQSLIFEPFVQLDSSLSRKHEGTGLGLNLVKKLVELGGGHIRVESEVGKGSKFIVDLPAETSAQTMLPKIKEHSGDAPASQQMQQRESPEPKEGLKPCALIIEDDPFSANLIREYLMELGLEAVTVKNGLEALEKAKQNLHRFSLITLDIMLPDKDGWDILTELKRDPKTADIPVIIISILPEREKGIALGAADFLVKPINKQQLVSTLKRICSKIEDNCSTILAIDDDPLALEMIQDMLKPLGVTFNKAFGGQEGLKKAQEIKPSVILLDLMMPDLNGFEVLEQLSSNPVTKNIPVIILTGKILSHEEKKKLNEKVFHIASKSQLKLDTFKKIIKKVLQLSIK